MIRQLLSLAFMGVFVVVVLVAVKAYQKSIAKQPLPALPPLATLPPLDAAKHYTQRGTPLFWEAVRGWQLNEMPPPHFGTPFSVAHVVLSSELLDFCTVQNGVMVQSFNFLVRMISGVRFDPHALPPGTAPPGFGVVTIETPSGRTLLVASQSFVVALQRAMQAAHGA